MAGAALLPGHGGFTSGLRRDFRIKGPRSRTTLSWLKIKSRRPCHFSEICVLASLVCWCERSLVCRWYNWKRDRRKPQSDHPLCRQKRPTRTGRLQLLMAAERRRIGGNYRSCRYGRFLLAALVLSIMLKSSIPSWKQWITGPSWLSVFMTPHCEMSSIWEAV